MKRNKSKNRKCVKLKSSKNDLKSEETSSGINHSPFIIVINFFLFIYVQSSIDWFGRNELNSKNKQFQQTKKSEK